MQVVTHRSGAEPFAAAIARRMLSQGSRALGQELSAAELTKLQARAMSLVPGITLARVSVTEGLAHQQNMAATAIENLWPGDADMQLIARETSAKAMGGLQGLADSDGDDASDEPMRPRG
jgi:hypothetical protein